MVSDVAMVPGADAKPVIPELLIEAAIDPVVITETAMFASSPVAVLSVTAKETFPISSNVP